MVRGIYQTSDAGGRHALVTFGWTVAFILIVVAGVCWSVQTVGDKICDMPGYWNEPYSGYTYSHYGREALGQSGFGFDKLEDKGDWPKGDYCGLSQVKVRRFVATNLTVPDDSRISRAYVYVKFDGKALGGPRTTLESYEAIE